MPSEPPPVRDSLRREVAARADAAWLIEPTRGVVLAASREAARLLDVVGPISGRDAGHILDASMPAVRRLRELDRDLEAGEERPVDLALWTRRGAHHRLWTVSRVGEHPHVLLLSCAVEAAANATPVPAEPSDDRATLKKIAERILNGRTAAAATGPPPDSRAETAEIEIEAAPSAPAIPARTANPAKIVPAAEHEPQNDAGPADGITPGIRARLAHELKSPLSAIASASEIMKDERLGPLTNHRYRDYATSIHAASIQALALIDRMIEDARKGAERAAQDFVEIDLNATARELVARAEPQAAAADLKLSASLAPTAPRITADPVSLRQMLDNLMTNAVKYTPAGGFIHVTTSGGGGTAAVIDITNSARLGRDRASGGGAHETSLGLGLPIVSELAARNGAHFRIAADDGVGTVARLTFPPNRLILI